MKLTILTENIAGTDFQAEPGISYLIEIDGEKILFDTGPSNVYLNNAQKMGINIHEDVKIVVLSHGHLDHGNGLEHIEGKTLICHPSCFIKRYRKADYGYIGLSLTKKEIQNKFNLIETIKPFQITEHLLFLGEIPRLNDFEAQSTTFVDEYGNEDYVPDDSALVASIKNELILITGCSHSGICNITEYAKKVTGISKVKVVLGGFHLKQANHQTIQTAKYFKHQKGVNVFPSHCTKPEAISALELKQFRQVKTGMVFQF